MDYNKQFVLKGRWSSKSSPSFCGDIKFMFNLTKKSASKVIIDLDNKQLAQAYHYPKYMPLETISWTTKVLEETHFYIIARPRHLNKYSHCLFQLRNIPELPMDNWSGFYQFLYPKDHGCLTDLYVSNRIKRNRPDSQSKKCL